MVGGGGNDTTSSSFQPNSSAALLASSDTGGKLKEGSEKEGTPTGSGEENSPGKIEGVDSPVQQPENSGELNNGPVKGAEAPDSVAGNGDLGQVENISQKNAQEEGRKAFENAAALITAAGANNDIGKDVRPDSPDDGVAATGKKDSATGDDSLLNGQYY